MFLTNVVDKNEKHILCPIHLFGKFYGFPDNVIFMQCHLITRKPLD
jgi:hypothetical protein